MTVTAPSPLVGDFPTDGVALLPRLLDPAGVAELRERIGAALHRQRMGWGFGSVMNLPALRAPETLEVMLDPRVKAVATELLGVERPMFTLEAGLSRNVVGGLWHKDSGELVRAKGYFDTDDPFTDPACRVIRFGLYLQDHADSTGLTVKRATQHSSSVSDGVEESLSHRAGDALVFDVRLTHRGANNLPRDLWIARGARLLPTARRGDVVEGLRRRAGAVASGTDRMAVFFTLALPSDRTRSYAQLTLERQLGLLTSRGLHEGPPPPMSSAFVAKLAAAGIDIPEGLVEVG